MHDLTGCDDRTTTVRAAAPAPPLDVTIIIMAYNEAPSIAAVVEELDATMRGQRWRYEILIVDDGSTDGTGAIATDLSRRLQHTRVRRHPDNRGIGEVYRTGFGDARGEYITFLPADGQFESSMVPQFLRHAGSADLVLGYIPDHRRPGLGRLLSFGERLLYRLMFGRLPEFQGIMLFRRSLLDQLGIRTGGRGWGVLMALIVHGTREGCRIVREPTRLRPRASGTSKVNNLRSVWANLRQAIQLRRSL